MERKEAEGGVKSNPVRKEYIDFLKIIAIYMVLFIHTSTKGSLIFIQNDHILHQGWNRWNTTVSAFLFLTMI